MNRTEPILAFLLGFIALQLMFIDPVCSQDSSSTYEIEQRIELLIANRKIEEANRLLNQKRSLRPEFILEKLNTNLELATESQDNKSLAYTHLSFGNFWYSRGNNFKAYEHYKQCEVLSMQLNDELLIGLSYLNLSNIENDPDLKAELLRTAIHSLEKVKSHVNIAKGYLNMGNVYLSKVNFNSGTDYQSLSHSLTDVSQIKFMQYRDSAFHYYHLARLIMDSIGSDELMPSIHVHYAEWYEHEQDYIKAEKYYRLAHDYFQLAGQTKGSVYCMLKLAHLNIRSDKYDSALILLNEVALVSKKLNYLDYLTEVYQKYVIVYESKGDYQKALVHQQQYSDYRTELNKQISQDKISLLNLQNKQSRQEIEIENLNNKKRIKNLIITLFTILTVFILLISYFVRKNGIRKVEAAKQLISKNKQLFEIEQSLLQSKIENQKLQKELLEEKVKERSIRLVDFANEMSKIENSLQQMNEKVKSIKPGKDQDQTMAKLQELRLSISQNMMEQSRLKELGSLSSTSNQEFFFYIEQHYKSITKDEKQLLSYLILDMSSKEISQYLNISTESVHKKRYRLRKKLKLERNETFRSFYSQVIGLLEKDNK